ncbi:hypothetical protein F4780DRAFT_336010 [Xylariomycetidae sp. FL0641]|nr:hypothetical protein F4780DRAFT_336010 [Xylariomycetidae sp. FL0641]
MGSLAGSEHEIRVLVTGFGPFKEQYPVNPSCEIAAMLPDYLPPDRAKDAGRRSRPDLPAVRIVKLPGAVRTSYEVVRKLVPTLWDDGEGKIDYAIHIGMAGPQLVYQLERRGHRDGYTKKDVDGALLEDEKRHKEEGDRWIWHGVPEELLTDLDVEDVYRRWKAHSPPEPEDLRGPGPLPLRLHLLLQSRAPVEARPEAECGLSARAPPSRPRIAGEGKRSRVGAHPIDCGKRTVSDDDRTLRQRYLIERARGYECVSVFNYLGAWCIASGETDLRSDGSVRKCSPTCAMTTEQSSPNCRALVRARPISGTSGPSHWTVGQSVAVGRLLQAIDTARSRTYKLIPGTTSTTSALSLYLLPDLVSERPLTKSPPNCEIKRSLPSYCTLSNRPAATPTPSLAPTHSRTLQDV